MVQTHRNLDILANGSKLVKKALFWISINRMVALSPIVIFAWSRQVNQGGSESIAVQGIL